MTTCLEDHKKESIEICSVFRVYIEATMREFRDEKICPTCALFAIASTVAVVFKNSTDISPPEIVKLMSIGAGNACGIHIETVDEGHIH